jgi:hypothetical protein
MAWRIGSTARLGVAVLVALAVWLMPFGASAESRLEFLSRRLQFPPPPGQADDFRVRTNAALALGATNDDGAVAPLCAGLADPSDIVRQAVAVALKRLSRSSSLECLRSRAAVETSPAVKDQVRRAIEAIAAAPTAPTDSGGAAPAVANARFYVALSRVTNHTSRTAGEVERIVHDAIAGKLAETGGYQLAPPSESVEAAKAALTKRRLKGYYLSIAVDKFDYSDEGLRVRVKIAVFSYPGRDLRGEVPSGAMLPGARPGDKAAEDQLMSVVAARAAELFTQNFQ